jgi:hypothetical protein
MLWCVFCYLLIFLILGLFQIIIIIKNYKNRKQFEKKMHIGCSFKFILKVGVEESIVNAPFVSLQNKNTNNTKSEVRFKHLIRDL